MSSIGTRIGLVASAAVGLGAAAWLLTRRDDPGEVRTNDRPVRPDPGSARDSTSTSTSTSTSSTSTSSTTTAPPSPRVATDTARLDAELGARFVDSGVPLHEWRTPDGPIRGVMLVVHGGGWYGVGADRLPTMAAEVERWNDRGWATLNVTYRPGGDSIVDVLRAYDALRAWQGADVPIGAIGASAGGHLSMLLGIERPDVAFVVSEAGPTDIPALGGNGFADGVREAGIRAFGDEAGSTRSPVARADELDVPLLIGNASNDGIVPVDQLHRMAAARPDARVVEFTPGDIPWVHSGVSAESLAQFSRAEDELAAAAGLPAT